MGITSLGNLHGRVPPQTETTAAVRLETAPARWAGQETGPDGDQDYISLREHELRGSVRAATRPALQEYTIVPGDTAWTVSRRFDTDVDTLSALNPQADLEALSPGDTLRVIQGFQGIAYVVEEGDSVSQLAGDYHVAVDAILTANALHDGSTLQVGDVVLLPGARGRTLLASRGETQRRSAPPEETRPVAVSMAVTAAVAPSAPSGPAKTSDWVWPIPSAQYFSEFGRRDGGFHSGLDMAVPTGTPAVAAQRGTVIFSAFDGGYGYCVIVDHGNGIKTRYAHADALLVKTGQTVQKGEKVILVGSSGRSTGPHLHFEVIVNDSPVNPRAYLP